MDLKNMTFDEKYELAQNPSTPVDVLRDLAKDGEWEVRENVALNPSTPEDILWNLSKDTDWYVRIAVAENQKVSINRLVKMFEHERSLEEPNTDIMSTLYEHKNLPAFMERVIETLYGKWL